LVAGKGVSIEVRIKESEDVLKLMKSVDISQLSNEQAIAE